MLVFKMKMETLAARLYMRSSIWLFRFTSSSILSGSGPGSAEIKSTVAKWSCKSATARAISSIEGTPRRAMLVVRSLRWRSVLFSRPGPQPTALERFALVQTSWSTLNCRTLARRFARPRRRPGPCSSRSSGQPPAPRRRLCRCPTDRRCDRRASIAPTATDRLQSASFHYQRPTLCPSGKLRFCCILLLLTGEVDSGKSR